MEPYLVMRSKRKINPLNVRPEDICVEDIAHHLSCINRFNGALPRPVSVAQHSVYVSRLCEGTGLEWLALFHDGGEAIVGDMTKWLKESPPMAAFREAEESAQRAVYQAFCLPPRQYEGTRTLMHPIVAEADRLMVRFEAEMGDIEIPNPRYGKLTPEEREQIGGWAPWPWKMAREAFLVHYRLLIEEGLAPPEFRPEAVAGGVRF